MTSCLFIELEFKVLGYEDRVALTGKDGGPVKTEITGKDGGPVKTQHVFQPSKEVWDDILRKRAEFERLRMVTQTKIPPLTVSNPWWGHDPSDKQWLGLYGYEECPDLFYGGAAGLGKTSFLLMAAVQYVHYPHYRALILRKTYADLSLPDAIMDRAIS